MEEAKQATAGKTGMGKGKKILVGVLLLGVAGVFGYLSIGIWGKDWLQMWSAYEARKFDAAVQSELDRLADMERADAYGGATPEETAKLILEALEKGDIELASKYYYVLDQEKAMEDFIRIQAEGNLEMTKSFFRDIQMGTKDCVENGDRCALVFVYTTDEDRYEKLPNNPEPYLVPKGSSAQKISEFTQNQYTRLWKARN